MLLRLLLAVAVLVADATLVGILSAVILVLVLLSGFVIGFVMPGSHCALIRKPSFLAVCVRVLQCAQGLHSVYYLLQATTKSQLVVKQLVFLGKGGVAQLSFAYEEAGNQIWSPSRIRTAQLLSASFRRGALSEVASCILPSLQQVAASQLRK